MYSYEERMRAVRLFVIYDKSAGNRCKRGVVEVRAALEEGRVEDEAGGNELVVHVRVSDRGIYALAVRKGNFVVGVC